MWFNRQIVSTKMISSTLLRLFIELTKCFLSRIGTARTFNSRNIAFRSICPSKHQVNQGRHRTSRSSCETKEKHLENPFIAQDSSNFHSGTLGLAVLKRSTRASKHICIECRHSPAMFEQFKHYCNKLSSCLFIVDIHG